MLKLYVFNCEYSVGHCDCISRRCNGTFGYSGDRTERDDKSPQIAKLSDKKDSGSHGDEKKDIGMKMWRSLEITSKQICKVDDMIFSPTATEDQKTSPATIPQILVWCPQAYLELPRIHFTLNLEMSLAQINVPRTDLSCSGKTSVIYHLGLNTQIDFEMLMADSNVKPVLRRCTDIPYCWSKNHQTEEKMWIPSLNVDYED
ncbi:hypothetical protein HGM15179_011791 [Zosterops borbonicus]|uniref:Uncharacterized protein n=1 Tax=Zosterops borbonicus TaxID=364589 RepID=A0A8K1LIL3_9PASS|nr:hypothetical protein HGM15179_011791 [Zosterops borbonicus]